MESMEAQPHEDIGVGSARPAGAKPPPAIALVRWALVVPAAVGVPVIIILGADALAPHWWPIVTPSWFVLLGFVLPPVSCVATAALVAPARRRRTALIAASVVTAAALGGSLLVALSDGWSYAVSASWATVGIAIGVAAAYGTALLVGGRRG